MIRRIVKLPYLYILFFLFAVSSVFAQQRIELHVLDEDTRAPLQGVSVRVMDNAGGTSTNAEGKALLTSSKSKLTVDLTLIGYMGTQVTLTSGLTNTVYLIPDTHTIDGVSVNVRRKYSNRNNPAVELIDLVIRNKYKNRLSGKAHIQFDQYDKLKLGMVDPPRFFRKGLESLNAMFDDVDTVTIPGKSLFTLYQEENVSNVYSQKDPSRFKKRIHQQKKTEFNPRYVNNPNIQSYLNFMFQPVDIYDESIFMMNKLILSPIADNGKIYYRYYIVDTITNEQGRFIKLNFEPRNKEDLLFSGHLMVSMDGSYAVKESELHIGSSANLNWINEAQLSLNYSPSTDGVMLLDTVKMAVLFGLRGNDAVYGERISVHNNYDLSAALDESVFAGAPIEVIRGVSEDTIDRPIALTRFEEKTYENIEGLMTSRNFNAALSIGYLLAQSYYNMGKFEFGPVEYLYSRNNVEGNRFRLGGRTTPMLSEKIFMEGYLAYGALDNRFKYFLRTAVSLNGESVAQFPAHYMEGTVQSDILEPGRAIGFHRGDSFFESFRRNRPTKWFDTDAYRLRHVVEFGNHVSIATGFTHTRQHTTGDFRLVSSGDPNGVVSDINTSEAHIELRWAPYEKFYYRNLSRENIIEKYPVFTVEYSKGLNGFLGGQYDYDKITASVSKRFFLNQLGFADMTVTGGKIWGTLPYTLLYLPNVRAEPTRHEIVYDLMNSMEFAADEYIKVGFQHQLNGYILNKIPLLKRLRLREIWGAQAFYGRMSPHNNPLNSDRVIDFDTDTDGNAITHNLGGVPYWEGSAGLDNILQVLKVEYVRRFTQTNFPNVNKDRYRVTLSLNF